MVIAGNETTQAARNALYWLWRHPAARARCWRTGGGSPAGWKRRCASTPPRRCSARTLTCDVDLPRRRRCGPATGSPCLVGSGQPGRARLSRPDRYDVARDCRHLTRLRPRHALLPRRLSGSPRGGCRSRRCGAACPTTRCGGGMSASTPATCALAALPIGSDGERWRQETFVGAAGVALVNRASPASGPRLPRALGGSAGRSAAAREGRQAPEVGRISSRWAEDPSLHARSTFAGPPSRSGSSSEA